MAKRYGNKSKEYKQLVKMFEKLEKEQTEKEQTETEETTATETTE